MAFPAPLALLFMGGAAYLLLSQKKSTPSGGSQLPAQPNDGAGTTITIPPNVLTDHPSVPAENAPTVTVQVPPASIPSYTTNPSQVPAGGYATGDKSSQATTPAQVITQALPQLVSGNATPAQVIAAAQQAAQAAGVTLPGVPSVAIPTTPLPTGTLPGPTPLQHEETQPQQDPHGTIALAKEMINAESNAGWKAALQNQIRTWQATVGIASDGKFGPASAYKMAEEVGILPLVRYWPKGTQLNADLKGYRDRLYSMAMSVATTNPALAAALRSSAGYETGVAYTGTPKAIDPSGRIAQAAALKKAIGA